MYLHFCLLSVLSSSQLVRQSPLFRRFSFLLTIIRLSRQAEIRWSICISKSQRRLCFSFSMTVSGLCIYHLFIWSNLNFLHYSQLINFPTQSCLVLYSFCANLLHSPIMWLVISSLSPYYLYLLFYCILSIFALTHSVLMVLFRVVWPCPSLFLLRFRLFVHSVVFLPITVLVIFVLLVLVLFVLFL